MDQKFDVFISYSSKDKSIADAVVAAIENESVRCWYAPRDIAPAADWADSITQAIQECSLMVLVFSETANRSQRVIDEINFAIDQGKPILPFRIEPHNPTGALSLHLSSRHWLDAYEPSWDVHLDRLVESVMANLGSGDGRVKISGGAASASVASKSKQSPRRTTVYFLAGLALVTILGLAGWKLLGGNASPASTATDTQAAAIPTTVAPSATEEELPEATHTPEISALISAPLIVHEDIISLDPQNADGSALAITRYLFYTLTKFDPETAEVVPAAAASWSVSPDGTIYTFTLHPDIPWVQHTLDGETVQVQDDEGNPRFLTAADFEFALKRICDPRQEVMFLELINNVVGCKEAVEYQDPETIPSELIDAIGVQAVSDTELIIHLIEPSAVFLTKTIHPVFSAVPSWAIEKYGEAWTNPGLIPSNGPFVIDQWVSGESVRLVRNQLLPTALQGEGNLGTVEFTVLSSGEESYQLWLDGELDYSEIPLDEQENHLALYPDQTTAFTNQTVFFAVFNHESEVFSHDFLRRAFSAALDRTRFLEEVIQIGGIPMIHLAPPGVFGAAPVDQIGTGYDPDYARAVLHQAGYQNCEDFPQITFYAYSGIANTYGQEISRFWEESLGCPEGTIDFQGSLIEKLSNGEEWDDWDIIITGWGSDFPDQDNWVGTLLSCEADNLLKPNRACSEIDDLIAQARVEVSPSQRRDLYWQIEEAFFGDEGSFPVAPLYTPYQYFAAREWVKLIQPITVEGFDLAGSSLDMDAKISERGE